MKYTLTITSDPNAYDWGDTDTILFEYYTTLPEGKELEDLVAGVISRYGWREDTAREIAENKSWWFIRNCADTDVVINEKGE